MRPFFHDHFVRLDRQIVLVDALAAFNAGPDAVRDLEGALAAILDCFRTGRRTLLSQLFRPRIDRILFAATKADHLHHLNHDRLEAILRRMVERAAARATLAGATIDVVALAAVRATREAQVRRAGELLPSIIGVPARRRARGRQHLRRRWPRPPCFRAICRTIRKRCSGLMARAFAASPRRAARTRIFASCACVRPSSN